MFAKGFFRHKRLLFVSPWLLAAAIGLMTLIIVIFASDNLRRQRSLIHDGLFLRGQAIARFVGAGTRAYLRRGLAASAETQSLIEQALADPNISYIAVVSEGGDILAHSDPSRVGSKLTIASGDLTPKGESADAWHIVSARPHPGQLFEVVSAFEPFRKGGRARGGEPQPGNLPPLHGGGEPRSASLPPLHDCARMVGPPPGGAPGPNDWCELMAGQGGEGWGGKGYKILVGLDMTEEDRVSRHNRFYIISLSLAMLLAGLGGWLSLLGAQGYRVSQETLRDIKAFTNLLILKLPVGIIATGSEGGIKTFNRAVARMTGLEPTAVVGCQPSAVLPEVLAHFFTGLAPQEEVLDREELLPTGRDSHLLVHLSSVPIVAGDGVFLGRVLLVYDVSELKNLEKRVRKHDRLISLGKMAAGVAHEVRNPLSSIKGFATLLGANFPPGSEEYDAARLLVREVERLNRCISELLDYAKPLPLQPRQLNLGELLQNSLTLVAGDARELGITISLAIPPGLPECWLDPDRLNQVMLNLYLNAMQAMASGGEMGVAVSLREGEERVTITVSDNGQGMSEEVLERLTDPYFTTKPNGTGLGLALVNKIIDEHGGSLRFTSELGRGTTAIIELPVAAKG